MKTYEKKLSLPGEDSLGILPSDIRFALRYREAMLSPRDIERLVGSGFARLGFYLAMKAADNNDSVQAELLARVSARGFNVSETNLEDLGGALTHLNAQETPFVSGVKLGQVSRYGLEHWVNRFDQVIAAAQDKRPEAPVFIVANAPYIGLDVFARRSLDKGVSLAILKPNRFEQESLPVGLVLSPSNSGTNIDTLPFDFFRPPDAIVFDDVIHSGQVQDQVNNFWLRQATLPPHFISAATVGSSPV